MARDPEKLRAWNFENREYRLAYFKTWRARNRNHCVAYAAEYREKLRQLRQLKEAFAALKAKSQRKGKR